MIISKTPFRMSFVGGGSDMPEFYRSNEGAVLSTSIDKYMYIAVHKKFDGDIRISYSKTEEVSSVNEIQHPIVREALSMLEIHGGLEITSLADIPSKGSGLGSSSSYAVGLLHALYAYKNQYVAKERLAREACVIEIEKCGEKIGKQDQYAASYGGLNLIRFHPDETVSVDPVIIAPDKKESLESSLLVFYTGVTRKANSILEKQAENINSKKTSATLKSMCSLSYDLKYELEEGTLDNFGPILHENWLLKKCLADGVSNSSIDDIYATAIKYGATGGKLMGAGSGGFLLFYVPSYRQAAVIKALAPLRRVKFAFDTAGSQTIFYQPEEFYND